MNKLRLYLQGKKTYVVGVGAVVAAAVAWAMGNIDNQSAIEAIVGALLAMFIRAGSATDAAKTNAVVEDTAAVTEDAVTEAGAKTDRKIDAK